VPNSSLVDLLSQLFIRIPRFFGSVIAEFQCGPSRHVIREPRNCVNFGNVIAGSDATLIMSNSRVNTDCCGLVLQLIASVDRLTSGHVPYDTRANARLQRRQNGADLSDHVRGETETRLAIEQQRKVNILRQGLGPGRCARNATVAGVVVGAPAKPVNVVSADELADAFGIGDVIGGRGRNLPDDVTARVVERRQRRIWADAEDGRPAFESSARTSFGSASALEVGESVQFFISRGSRSVFCT